MNVNLPKYLQVGLQVIESRSSALTPLLWLDAIIGIPCIFLFYFSTDLFHIISYIGIVVFLLLFTAWKYHYILNKNPKMLQSESYRLESQKLDIIAKKGGPALNALDVPIVAPPRTLPPATQNE